MLVLSVLNELHEHLGICFAFEGEALLGKLFAQDGIVFNNTIVHDDDVAGVRHMRVSVAHRGLSVSSPAGMCDTHRTRAVLAGSGCLQVSDLTLGFVDIELVLAIDQCHTGRVVTTVFQAVESTNQYVIGLTLANVSYYSTHK